MPKNLTELSEQIQSDIICIMDSHYGEVEYVQETIDILCQAVVDRVNELKKSNENSLGD